MLVEIRETPFAPYAELAAFESRQGPEQRGKAGASSLFVGTLRDFNDGEVVRELWMEHYPAMTERELGRIAKTAQQRWPIVDAFILHRAGRIQSGEAIVLIATWSVHRAAALAATAYIIEELKQRAPFWKKETLMHGDRWVEHNTPACSSPSDSASGVAPDTGGCKPFPSNHQSQTQAGDTPCPIPSTN